MGVDAEDKDFPVWFLASLGSGLWSGLVEESLKGPAPKDWQRRREVLKGRTPLSLVIVHEMKYR